jgi:hypothetical protein
MQGMNAQVAPPPAKLLPYLGEARAALCLVDSLMLALLDAGVLTREQIIFAIETSIKTKRRASADGDDPALMDQAVVAMGAIANSLAAAREHSGPDGSAH